MHYVTGERETDEKPSKGLHRAVGIAVFGGGVAWVVKDRRKV